MKKKLTKVFITGLCILSSSFVLAQGVDAEDNAINPNVRSRPGMNPDNTSVDAQERSREHMDSQNRRLDAQGRTIQDRSAQDRSKDEMKSDNTGMNVQDRKQADATAEGQSNDKNDLTITQRIRKDLVENDYLSTYAKNVKVITNQGKVILRGPVNSSKEKNDIEVMAKNIAGAKNVENRLTVEQ